MTNTTQQTSLLPETAELVDDALAKINLLGPVAAMKWLAARMQETQQSVRDNAERYEWLRAGHMEYGVQPDNEETSERADWYWMHSGDVTPDAVDSRIDNSRSRFPLKKKP